MNRNARRYRTETTAETLINLGRSLVQLRRFEEAEEAYREAVELYQKVAQSGGFVAQSRLTEIQNNLGTVLRRLGRLPEAEAIFREVVAARRPLVRVRSEQYAAPLATALTNLGNVLEQRGQQREALECHQEAVAILRPLARVQPQVFERTLFQAQNNLGNALCPLGKFEEAVKLYQEIVEVRRRWVCQLPEAYGPELAVALINLGSTREQLGQIQAATVAYEEAQRLLPTETHPDRLAHVLARLGQLRLQQGLTAEALAPLVKAARLIEELRLESLTLDRRLKVMRENVACFDALVLCLVRLGRDADALAVAERGRGRSIVHLVALRDTLPVGVPPEVAREHGQLLIRLRVLEESTDLGAAEEESAKVAAHSLGQVRERVTITRRLLELGRRIQQQDPVYLRTGRSVGTPDIAALAQTTKSILLQFRVTGDRTFAFLVFPSGTVSVVEAPHFTLRRLQEFLLGSGQGGNEPGWLVATNILHNSAQRSPRSPSQSNQVIGDTLARLYGELVGPVHEALRQGLQPVETEIQNLVVVPSRGLSLFPLHACWWKEGGHRRYLLDEYRISYAPSLTLYERCWALQRRQQPFPLTKQTLLAVANPTSRQPLPFAEWECAKIQRYCGNRSRVLAGTRSTLTEVQQHLPHADLLHFACHALSQATAPLRSRIDLAAGEALTLATVLEQVELRQGSLVTLSACESSVVDFQEASDEHFGLPLGFLCAGATTVYGSLWSVPDRPTALLMAKLYERLATGDGRPEALRQAQRWLRDATIEELISAAEDEPGGFGPDFLDELAGAYEEHPYASLRNWAPFQCVGA